MSPVFLQVLQPYCPLSASLAVAEAIKKREQVVPKAAEAEKNRRQLAPRAAEVAVQVVQVAPQKNPKKKPKNKNPKVAEVAAQVVQVAPQKIHRSQKAAEVSLFHAVRMICSARLLTYTLNLKI